MKPWFLRDAHLHADHSVDEKDHRDEQTDIRQSLSRIKSRAPLHKISSLMNILWLNALCCTDLEWLDKSPEEGSNAFSFAEQFNQPQHSEQTEKCDGHFSTLSFATALKQMRQKQV